MIIPGPSWSWDRRDDRGEQLGGIAHLVDRALELVAMDHAVCRQHRRILLVALRQVEQHLFAVPGEDQVAVGLLVVVRLRLPDDDAVAASWNEIGNIVFPPTNS